MSWWLNLFRKEHEEEHPLATTDLEIRSRRIENLLRKADWKDAVADEYAAFGQTRNARLWRREAKELRGDAWALQRLQDEYEVMGGLDASE